jgi:hypothetical protein
LLTLWPRAARPATVTSALAASLTTGTPTAATAAAARAAEFVVVLTFPSGFTPARLLLAIGIARTALVTAIAAAATVVI